MQEPSLLVCRHTIAENCTVPNSVMSFSTTITCMAFASINDSILYSLYNTSVICGTILPVVCPIKKDSHAGRKFNRIISPLSSLPEPVHAIVTSGIFRYNTSIHISALICTPRYKASAPFNAASKSVPRPVRLATDITYLRKSHLNNHIVRAIYAIEDCHPHRVIYIKQFLKLFVLICIKTILV